MATVEEVRKAARRLPPVKQIQLIQELLQDLQQEYPQPTNDPAPSVQDVPITNLNDLAADFWSAHELVEEPQNCYVPRRERERLREHLRERAIGS